MLTANRTIGQFLSGGSGNLKTMETILHNTEKVVQQFNTIPAVRQVPLVSAANESVQTIFEQRTG